MSEKIICYCKNVSENNILDAIKQGANSLKDIQKMTKACTGNQCKKLNPKGKCCMDDINNILKKFNISDTKSSCCSCGGDCC